MPRGRPTAEESRQWLAKQLDQHGEAATKAEQYRKQAMSLQAKSDAERAKQKETLSNIRRFLKNDPHAVVAVDPSTGETPLHVACRQGQTFSLISALVKAYPGAAATIDRDSNTPLLAYIKASKETSIDVRVLRILLDAYPNAIETRDDHLRTPLSVCCAATHLQAPAILELVSRRSDATLQHCTFGDCVTPETIFHRLLKLHRRGGVDDDIQELLQVFDGTIDKCPKAVSLKYDRITIAGDIEGQTPLQMVLYNEDADIDDGVAELFVSRVPDSILVEDSDGWTALHIAVSKYRLHDLGRRMIELRPEALKAKTRDGSTPLHVHCDCTYLVFETMWAMLATWPLSTLVMNNHGSMPFDFVSFGGEDDEDAVALLHDTTQVTVASLLECLFSPLTRLDTLLPFPKETRDAVGRILPFELFDEDGALDEVSLWKLATSLLSMKKIDEIAKLDGMQDLIQNAGLDDMACGFVKMHRAGRSYFRESPHDKEQGMEVLLSVIDSLDCLYHHVRENPHLCFGWE